MKVRKCTDLVYYFQDDHRYFHYTHFRNVSILSSMHDTEYQMSLYATFDTLTQSVSYLIQDKCTHVIIHRLNSTYESITRLIRFYFEWSWDFNFVTRMNPYTWGIHVSVLNGQPGCVFAFDFWTQSEFICKA